MTSVDDNPDANMVVREKDNNDSFRTDPDASAFMKDRNDSIVSAGEANDTIDVNQLVTKMTII